MQNFEMSSKVVGPGGGFLPLAHEAVCLIPPLRRLWAGGGALDPKVYEQNPVRDVEPMQLVAQYLTKTAIKPPSGGDNTRSSVQHPL